MVDIDVYGQTQQYTPRQTDIVDAIAETRRITEAAMRSNPLRNAYIDDGLMKWHGNYAGGPLGGAFLWIGEFRPNDQILNKPQRGFILSRDDSSHSTALWLYDPFPSTTKPLRQLLAMRDADNKNIMIEGRDGGTAFPWAPIPLYSQITDRVNIFVDNGSGGSIIKALPVIGAINGIQAGVDRMLYRGRGPMVGNRIRYRGNSNSTGSTYGVFLVVAFDDPAGTTISTPVVNATGGSFQIVTADFKAQGMVGRQVEVQVWGRGVSGDHEWDWIYVEECCSYSDYA